MRRRAVVSYFGNTAGPDTIARSWKLWRLDASRQPLVSLAAPASFGFLVCRKSDHALAGVVNVSNVVLGAFRSGYLGYYAFSGFERQGIMAAGLHLVVRRAFGPLRLHRLEANIQPGNLRSIALVRACRFVREGYSPRYLKINGRWRDHERWAIIAT